MYFNLKTITILTLATVTTAIIRPATIIPHPAPRESHTIEPIFIGEQLTPPEPQLVHIPPAHPSPDPAPEEIVSTEIEQKRLHARHLPVQHVIAAREPSSASHGQQEEISADIAAMNARLQAREVVENIVHARDMVAAVVQQLQAAAVHKREVERIHKLARRAKTEAALQQVREVVRAVLQRRAEIQEEERRERLVEGVREMLAYQ